MSEKYCIAVIVLIFAISGVSQTPSPTPETLGPILTEEVVINVTANSRNGSPAANLSVDDLVILDNGRLRPPTSVSRKVPSVLIAMDTGGEIRQKKNINTTRQIAEIIVNGLRDDAEIALMHFHDRQEVLTDGWTNDKQELVRIIRSRTNFGRRASFTAGADLAIKLLGSAPTDDRHLVLITDGVDAAIDREANAEMMQRLWRSGFTVHVISYTQMEFDSLKPQARIWRKGEPNPKRMPEEMLQALTDSLPLKRIEAEELMARVYPPRLIGLLTDTSFIGHRRSHLRALTRSHLQLSAMTEYTGGTFVLPETLEEMLEKTKIVIDSINSQFVVTFEPAQPVGEAAFTEIRRIEVSSRNRDIRVEGSRHLIVFAKQKN